MSVSSSRGITRVSKNPKCMLQAAMALKGVKEPEFYEAVTGEPYLGEYGERLPARRRGSKFEKNLFENDAALLRAVVAPKFGLDPDEIWVRNFQEEIPGPPHSMRLRRLKRFESILADLLAGKRVPELLIEAQLKLPTRDVGAGFYISPDFLVYDSRVGMYVPGEIKSFITRENVAEPADKDLTRRQAAAEILALRATIERIRNGWSACVDNRAVFVFAKPVGLVPADAFVESIDSAVHEVDRGMDAMAETMRLLESLRKKLGDVALANLVEDIPTNFQDTCHSTCVMAGYCEKRHVGTARVLGDSASDLLRAGTRLDRIASLVISGGGSAEEQEIARVLRRAAVELGIDEGQLAGKLA